jgi:hypothetical protein
MKDHEAIPIDLQLGDETLSADDLDSLTRALHSELSELPIERVNFTAGTAPPRAKVADPVTLGALAIAVLPSFLPKVLEFLERWAQRSSSLTMKLKIARAGTNVEIELPASSAGTDQLRKVLQALDAPDAG